MGALITLINTEGVRHQSKWHGGNCYRTHTCTACLRGELEPRVPAEACRQAPTHCYELRRGALCRTMRDLKTNMLPSEAAASNEKIDH